jgi:cob(I)alamin adenosyltransferase
MNEDGAAYVVHPAGRSMAAAEVHRARAITRRAERAAVAAAAEVALNPQALAYINRCPIICSCWRGF